MSPKIDTIQKRAVASDALHDAYTDFILSRQAMLCTPKTLLFYKNTAGKFIKWLEGNGVNEPGEVSARHVRMFLAELAGRGLADTTIHGNARAIKTLLRFWHAETYIDNLIQFQMPKLSQKRLLVLSVKEVKEVLEVADTPRDKAIILLLVDSGLRRAEVTDLNWGDIDVKSGLVRVEKGKGGKARSVVVGITTRRALLKYRRFCDHEDNKAVFQTSTGKRLSAGGLRSVVLRLSKISGVHVTPHALRRTFATLSLRAGMNILHLQGLLGHASLEMTRHYVQMIDDDLLKAHKEHGPIDSFL